MPFLCIRSTEETMEVLMMTMPLVSRSTISLPSWPTSSWRSYCPASCGWRFCTEAMKGRTVIGLQIST